MYVIVFCFFLCVGLIDFAATFVVCTVGYGFGWGI